MLKLLGTAIAASALVAILAGAAGAAPNPAIEALQHTPLSLFSYGLAQLEEEVNATFTRPDVAPFASFTAPLAGHVADIATVIYQPGAETITINLVKVDKLPDGATPNDACAQAMTALREFAGLDPVSGQLQAGMEASLLTSAFAATGTTPTDSRANDMAALDKSFALVFSGQIERGRFRCRGPLFGTSYSIDK